MNETVYTGFFDELSKIAAAFANPKVWSQTAMDYAKTLKGLKSGTASNADKALYRVQNSVRDLRAAKAARAGAPAPVVQSTLDKIKARNAAGNGATKRRFVSETPSAMVNPQTGRAQTLMDMKKRLSGPSNPQVEAAQKAEASARSGQLGAAPKMRIL